MSDDETFRRGVGAGVIMMLIGAVGLAAGGGAAFVAGGGALVFGLFGVFVAVGQRRGWLHERGRAKRPRPAQRPRPAPDGPRPPDRPVPRLSGLGQVRVAEIVAALHGAGVLAPDAPDPAHLYESVADHGEPVTVDAVLGALGEASYYHPGFRPESCAANLVCHGTQVEQFEDYLREQIDDLVRLAGGALTVVVADIEQAYVDGSRQVLTRIRWTVDGSAQTLRYAGAAKYLSTVIHVTLARAMARAPRRPASLCTDQGLWITTLPEDGVERLNRALGLDADSESFWEWVADQEPLAAGDVGMA